MKSLTSGSRISPNKKNEKSLNKLLTFAPKSWYNISRELRKKHF